MSSQTLVVTSSEDRLMFYIRNLIFVIIYH